MHLSKDISVRWSLDKDTENQPSLRSGLGKWPARGIRSFYLRIMFGWQNMILLNTWLTIYIIQRINIPEQNLSKQKRLRNFSENHQKCCSIMLLISNVSEYVNNNSGHRPENFQLLQIPWFPEDHKNPEKVLENQYRIEQLFWTVDGFSIGNSFTYRVGLSYFLRRQNFEFTICGHFPLPFTSAEAGFYSQIMLFISQDRHKIRSDSLLLSVKYLSLS